MQFAIMLLSLTVTV